MKNKELIDNLRQIIKELEEEKTPKKNLKKRVRELEKEIKELKKKQSDEFFKKYIKPMPMPTFPERPLYWLGKGGYDINTDGNVIDYLDLLQSRKMIYYCFDHNEERIKEKIPLFRINYSIGEKPRISLKE